MLHLDPILPAALLIPLLAGLAVLDWRFARARPPLVRGARIAIWLTLAVLAARPSRVVVSEIVDRARLLIVEDVSGSMTVRDADGGKARQVALRDARNANQQALAELRQHFDVRELQLGSTTGPSGSTVAADATAIGDGLSTLADRAAGTRVAGIVLFSDGRNNSGIPPEIAAARLGALEVPVHTVQVGRDKLADDVVDAVLLDLQAPLTTEVAIDAAVTITGTARNLANQTVTILAAVDDEPLAAVDTFTPQDPNASFRQVIEVPMPAEAGFHTLHVALSSDGHEITPLNNRMSAPFRARDDAIRILFLEGALRAEFKFLRRLLEDNDAFTPTIAPPFLLAGPAGKIFLDELKLSRYDVIIIGDLPAGLLPRPVADGIVALVRNRGAGLLILGGPRNLDPTHWQQHPLAPTLPFAFSSGAKAPETQSFAPKPPVPAPSHFLATAINDPAYTAVWQLPPLRGLRNPAVAANPLGTTLLLDQSNRPLLVASDYGTGRVVATLHDASWNWQTENDPAPAFHRELFTRTVYYLASREDAMNSRLSISAGRSRLRLGTPLQVRGSLLGADGAPVTDAAIQLTLRHLEDGDLVTVPMVAGQGRYLASASLTKPGPYALQAATSATDSQLLSNELRIIVYDDRLEDRNILADPDTLAAIATESNGTYRTIADLPALLEFLPSRARTITVRKTESSQSLWDTLPLYLILLIAATITWLPRQKKTSPAS